MLVKRLGWLDKILLLTSFIGAVLIGFVLLREDLIIQNLLRRQFGDHKIGKIIDIKNDVRRRRNQSLTWYPAFATDSLFERDSLFTGADSEIELIIGKKLSVHLNPNCLVVLQSRNNEIVFDLQLGSIVVKSLTKEPVKILSKGKMVILKPSETGAPMQIIKNKDGEIKTDDEVEKEEKAAQLAQEQVKPPEPVEATPSPTLPPPAPPPDSKISAKFALPKDHANLLKDANEAVEFQWTVESTVVGAVADLNPKLKLQISTTKIFDKIILESDVTEKKYLWSEKVGEGTYYYRLVEALSLEPVSQTLDFKLSLKPPVAPLKPVAVEKKIVPAPKPKPKPKPKPTPATVASPPQELEKPKPEPAIALESPNLFSPADKTILVNFNQTEISPTLFAWKKIELADGYEIQFAEDSDFKNILWLQKTTSNQFILKKILSKKPVLWRVRAKLKESSSEWSKPRSFEVQSSG